jgi:hypothetical protein
MKRYILTLVICLLMPSAHAWNGAGHRLSALIAWQELSEISRLRIQAALLQHPDYSRWRERSRSDQPSLIFAEAATWPDSIRHDPRYYDERFDTPTPPIPGLIDHAKHKNWHYADSDAHGQTAAGELDQQIERLDTLIRTTAQIKEITWVLPWLIHLVADIHQPLHVGHAHDEGGNLQEIENPFRRQPFQNLHSYWDELPGPASLRGKRLEKRAQELADRYPAPTQGKVSLWRKESHGLLKQAYPQVQGSLLPIISEAFDQEAQRIADRRIAEAGYRLGRMLEDIFRQRVSRETGQP